MKTEPLRIGVLCEEDGVAYLHTASQVHRFHERQMLDSAYLLRFMEHPAIALDQLWIHESWAPHYVTGGFWAAARERGWTVKQYSNHVDAPWVTCYRPGTWGAREISVPCLDNRAPWSEARTGPELLQALTLFQAQVGLPFRFSPGSTGTALMRLVHQGGTSRKVELEPLRNVPPPAREDGGENPFAWTRLLDKAELSRRWLYSWDKNAAYLGACSSLELGRGEAEHVRDWGAGLTFDPHLPGYWECMTKPWTLDNLPDPLRPVSTSRQGSPTLWLTTPTVVLAQEWGAIESIASAWVWRRHGRDLSAFYERMRDARLALGDRARSEGPEAAAARIARDAVKSCYTFGFGYLDQYARDAHGETLHRPDWRHAIVAQARANHFRKLVKVTTFGHKPFAVMTDCDYFLSDVEDAEAARPSDYQLGEGLGCYKLHDAVPVDQVRDILAGLCDEDAGRRWQAFRALQRRLNEIRAEG